MDMIEYPSITEGGSPKTYICTCYVQHLPIKDQFCLRWGAHSLDCPTYRKSGDHCDNLDDIATRNHHCAGIIWSRWTWKLGGRI